MVRGKDVPERGLDVGFLCQGYPPDVGGVESHVRDLAAALAARGHRVHVLCLDYGEGLEPYSTRDGVVEGVAVRRMAYRYHDQTALADVVDNARANDVVLAWQAETPCDVVHVHHATGFGLGALRAVRDVGQPLVMTLHDYWPLCPRGQMLRHDGGICAVPEPAVCGVCLAATWPHLMPSGGGRLEAAGGGVAADDAAAAGARTRYALASLELAHALFTPSARARAVYAAAGLVEARVRVVENGVEVGALAAEVARLRPGRRDRLVHLGVLGSVIPSKGVLELARAVQRAAAPRLVLDVHGNLPSYHGDTSYVEALRALADREPRVQVHGAYARAELPGILAGLDGVAAPSRWEEVYGLTVREAAAAGLPVIVSDAGGLPELVEGGGGGGVVVARDDEEAWVRALERFAEDPGGFGVGKGGVVLRTAEEMAAELEGLYVEVIREVTGAAPAGVVSAPVAGEDVPAKRSFLGRLFGRG